MFFSGNEIMKLKPLSAFILLAMPLAGVHAAALDRSGQSISAFLQTGNYAEIGYSDLTPEVSGRDTSGNSVPEMAEDYHFINAGLKVDINPQISLGLLYDQPYGAAAEYQGQNDFTANNNSYVLSPTVIIPNSAIGITGSTNVSVESHNLTALIGFKPMTNLTVFGGAAFQSIEGEVNLRGPAYSVLSGYSAMMDSDDGVGYVLGMAFEKPEIALKAAVTYRSEIDHELDTSETVSLPTAAFAALQGTAYKGVPAANVLADATQKLALVNAALAQDPNNVTLLTQQAQLQGAQRLATLAQLPASGDSKTKITTPQSVNLDFQTGIMKDTLVFANMRWVDWSSFSIKPSLFAQTTGLSVAGGLNLVDYTDDQWSANVGVGRKLTPDAAASLSVGWDSGAGNPITTLGPTEGYWNVGLGMRMNVSKAMDVSVGLKYFWLGDADAKVSSGTKVGEFTDNNAFAFGVKMGYHF
jgi:long-chain fatty acid transport protein